MEREKATAVTTNVPTKKWPHLAKTTAQDVENTSHPQNRLVQPHR